MGSETPPHPHIQRMVQRPQTCCCGRQHSKEGGNPPHSCFRHGRTPGPSQNPHLIKQKLLVAWHEKLCYTIHQRLHTLPIAQKHHHTPQTPAVPHYNKPRSAAVQVHSLGLHHQTTTIRRLQLLRTYFLLFHLPIQTPALGRSSLYDLDRGKSRTGL